MIYYGKCWMVDELKKDKVPEECITKILFDCLKIKGCAPCVLHEWVGD